MLLLPATILKINFYFSQFAFSVMSLNEKGAGPSLSNVSGHQMFPKHSEILS